MVTACVLLIAGRGDSNSAEDSAGTDSQIVENTKQTDTEENVVSENIDDTTTSNETQESMKNIRQIAFNGDARCLSMWAVVYTAKEM